MMARKSDRLRPSHSLTIGSTEPLIVVGGESDEVSRTKNHFVTLSLRSRRAGETRRLHGPNGALIITHIFDGVRSSHMAGSSAAQADPGAPGDRE